MYVQRNHLGCKKCLLHVILLYTDSLLAHSYWLGLVEIKAISLLCVLDPRSASWTVNVSMNFCKDEEKEVFHEYIYQMI